MKKIQPGQQQFKSMCKHNSHQGQSQEKQQVLKAEFSNNKKGEVDDFDGHHAQPSGNLAQPIGFGFGHKNWIGAQARQNYKKYHRWGKVIAIHCLF